MAKFAARWGKVSSPIILALTLISIDGSGQAATLNPENESDRIMLGTAATACKNRDIHEFLDAFFSSNAVQKKYSAAEIAYVEAVPNGAVSNRKSIGRQAYSTFPIQMVDNYRKFAHPPGKGGNEHVIIDVEQSRNDAISVAWTRIRYDGKASGGDDLGNAFTLDGKPYAANKSMPDGRLLFAPSGGCWQLRMDTRYFRGKKAK